MHMRFLCKSTCMRFQRAQQPLTFLKHKNRALKNTTPGQVSSTVDVRPPVFEATSWKPAASPSTCLPSKRAQEDSTLQECFKRARLSIQVDALSRIAGRYGTSPSGPVGTYGTRVADPYETLVAPPPTSLNETERNNI